ncbi:MAG: tetratricopeptide repeat protein [Pirellulales bacterium]|nr:tetratricopeptide repeat protein [Pirellulales bacterium]
MKTNVRLSLVCSLGIVCTIPLGCSNLASQGINVDGVRMYQQGNYQQAAYRFQEAIANDPTSPDGYYNLAAVLHQSGRLNQRESDYRQAEDLYNQCLEYDPNHVECYRGLAVLLTETGRTDAAFRLLQGWKASQPNLANPRIELARLHQETGSTDAAKGQLVEALAIEPHNGRALAALGRIRDSEGDYRQALENYQRSLAVNRHQPDLQNRVAALQAALGQPAALSSNGTEPVTRVVQQPASSVRY